MAEPSEGLILLSWISDQDAQYKGLVAQLTGRLVWDKVHARQGAVSATAYMNVCNSCLHSCFLHSCHILCCLDRTTVLVDAPYIDVCAAVHMQGLMQSLGDDDSLGLRERLLIMYDRPRFLRSAQLQDACARIPKETLHNGYLGKNFWQLHIAHAPAHHVQ